MDNSRRPGTSDQGHDYEWMTVAYLVINLLNDKNILDFEIRTNVINFGSFDDIVLEITTATGVEKFAFQLKHKENVVRINQSGMEGKDSKFGIRKYFNDYRQLDIQEYNLMFYSNIKTPKNWDGQVKIGDQFVIQAEECDIPLPISQRKAWKFSLKSHTVDDGEYKDLGSFTAKFYYCVGQPNLGTTERLATEDFQKYFGTNKSRPFFDFIKSWCNTKRPQSNLTRRYVSDKLAECLLSPFLVGFPEVTGNQFSELLAEVINKFQVVYIDKESSHIGKLAMMLHTPEAAEKSRILRKFNITPERNDPVSLMKVLWYLNRFPLIVDVNAENTEVISKALLFCNGNTKKFIFLVDGNTELKTDASTFRSLEDLLAIDSSLYQQLVRTFSISLQGKQSMPLSRFIDNDGKLQKFFTPTHLIQMLGGCIQVGDPLETLPKHYINRKVSTFSVDTEILSNTDDQNIALVTCDDREIFKTRFKAADLSPDWKKSSWQVFWCPYGYPRDPFNDTVNCHFFEYFAKEDKLQWLKSSGNINFVRKYHLRSKESTPEASIRGNSGTNVICDEPGMGKTSLLKNIKNNSNPAFWTIAIEPKNQEYWRTKHKPKATEDYVLHCKEDKLVRILYENKRIILMWDGLDEMSEDKLPNVLDAVRYFEQLGVSQWISSRTILQSRLENELNVLTRSIAKLDEEQQKFYLLQRFEKLPSEQLEELVGIVMNNLKVQKINELFGIPLQLYMLTDLFLRFDSTFIQKCKSNRFSIAMLFEHFLEAKFTFHVTNKLQISAKNNDQRDDLISFSKAAKFEEYETAALSVFVDDNILRSLNISAKNISLADGIGVIVGYSGGKPHFAHMTYAEFLAAKYLSNHVKILVCLKGWFFEQKNNNIRYFFDVITAGDSDIHLAVLYRDVGRIKELVQNLDPDSLCEDSGGRNPLHIACCWGAPHPVIPRATVRGCELYADLIRNIESEGGQVIDDEVVNTICKGPSEEQAILNCLLQVFHPEMRDRIFLYNAFQYADKSLSLYSIEILNGAVHPCELRNLENFRVVPSVLYYGIKFGYANLLEMINDYPKVVTKTRGYDWYNLAIQSNNVSFLKDTIPLHNPQNTAEESPLSIACREGQTEIVKYLTQKDVDGSIFEAVQIACEYGRLNILKYLLEAAAKIDKANGVDLIKKAARKGHLEVIKYLVEKGAHVIGPGGSEALTIASMCGHFDIVTFLVETGAEVEGSEAIAGAARAGSLDMTKYLFERQQNAQLENHISAIQMACLEGHLHIAKYLYDEGTSLQGHSFAKAFEKCAKNGHLDIIKFLVEKGADIDDETAGKALRSASSKGHFDIIKYFADKNSDVIRKYGADSIVAACANGHLNILQYLIDQGGNIQNSTKIKALEGASREGHLEIVKYLIEKGVDGPAAAVINAAYSGHLEIVKLLLPIGTKVEEAIAMEILHGASQIGRLGIVEYFVGNGIVNLRTSDGSLAVAGASRRGCLDIVEYLLDHGARADDCRLALKIASWEGHLDIVEVLLAKGTSVAGEIGASAVKSACYPGRLDIVQTLLEHGASVRGVGGTKALAQATRFGYWDIVKCLVDNGAKIQGQEGIDTTYIIACRYGDFYTVRFLAENGMTYAGGIEEVIQIATKYYHSDIANYLSQYCP